MGFAAVVVSDAPFTAAVLVLLASPRPPALPTLLPLQPPPRLLSSSNQATTVTGPTNRTNLTSPRSLTSLTSPTSPRNRPIEQDYLGSGGNPTFDHLTCHSSTVSVAQG